MQKKSDIESMSTVSAITPDIDEEMAAKPRKKSKKDEQTAQPDYSMWSSDAPAESKVVHFTAPQKEEVPSKNAAVLQQPVQPEQQPLPVQVSAAAQTQSRPEQVPQSVQSEESAETGEDKKYLRADIKRGFMGTLFSDSGKAICSVMRVITYLLFAIAPFSFIKSILDVLSYEEAGAIDMVSGIIGGIISAAVYIIAGFLVIALIKILQNLMAMPKKK